MIWRNMKMRVIDIDKLEWFQVKFQARDEQCILIRKPHINNLNWFESDDIKTAKWNWIFNRPYTADWGNAYITGWECSNCGHGASVGVHEDLDDFKDENALKAMYDERGNYCSNCGAKMELEE